MNKDVILSARESGLVNYPSIVVHCILALHIYCTGLWVVNVHKKETLHPLSCMGRSYHLQNVLQN